MRLPLRCWLAGWFMHGIWIMVDYLQSGGRLLYMVVSLLGTD